MSVPLALPTRSLFAVWHWPRWTWGVIAVLGLAGYVLSAVPVYFLLEVTGTDNDTTESVFIVVYLPIVWACESSEFASAAVDWQYEQLEWIFGYLDR